MIRTHCGRLLRLTAIACLTALGGCAIYPAEPSYTVGYAPAPDYGPVYGYGAFGWGGWGGYPHHPHWHHAWRPGWHGGPGHFARGHGQFAHHGGFGHHEPHG